MGGQQEVQERRRVIQCQNEGDGEGLREDSVVSTTPSSAASMRSSRPVSGSVQSTSNGGGNEAISRRCLVLGKGTELLREALADIGLSCTGGRVSWRLLWSPTGIPTEVYKQLAPYQVVNRLPLSKALTRKDALVVNIRRMVKRHGAQFLMMIPKTYLLPAEADKLLAAMKSKPQVLWIIKPTTGSQGKDIVVTRARRVPTKLGEAIVSRYIRPFLIDGRKFDLRLYVVITSVDPLRVYLYREGLVRFATEPYTTDGAHLGNRFIHLTNVAVNREHPDYDDSSELGHKRRLSSLWRTLGEANATSIQAAIHSLIAKAVISAHSVLSAGLQHHVPHRRANQLFELFGFDVLLDNHLHPWLLEVNRCPTLSGSSDIDVEVKKSMLSDLFALVGLASSGSKSRPGGSASPNMPSIKRQTIGIETDREFARRLGWDRVYPRYEEHPKLSLAQFFEQRDTRILSAQLCARIPCPINLRAKKDQDWQKRPSTTDNSSLTSRLTDRALLRRMRNRFGMQFSV